MDTTKNFNLINNAIKKINFQGEKKRDQAPASGGSGVQERNEIVACTSCGNNGSPCTHSANNGCATEVILYFNGIKVSFYSLMAVDSEICIMSLCLSIFTSNSPLLSFS